MPEPVVLPVEQARGPVEAAAFRELEAVDRHESAAGAAALRLARSIDVGANTGSQLAALSRELRETLAAATKGAARQATRLDELKARREAKATG